MSTIIDVVDGTAVAQSKDGGITATRAFIVTDLQGDAATKMSLALTADQIPAIYDYHPSFGSLRCNNKRVEPITANQFRVLCDYVKLDNSESPEDEPGEEPAQISVGSTVQSKQTTNKIDINTGQITPITIGPLNYSNEDGSTFTKPSQTGLVNIQVPQTTIRFQKRENEDPLNKSLKYVGKTNSTQFLGIPQGDVLCSRLEGSTNDGGTTYDVTYEFQVDLDGWKADIVYIDQDTGLPASQNTDPADGDPILTSPADDAAVSVDIYQQENFNDLELQ